MERLGFRRAAWHHARKLRAATRYFKKWLRCLAGYHYQTSQHHPHRVLYNSYVWSRVCLLPKDIKMPPKAPTTGALCHVAALCFNLIIATYLRKVVLWHLGSGWPHPNTNGQHSGALRFRQNRTKWRETSYQDETKWECNPCNPVLSWLWLLTACFKGTAKLSLNKIIEVLRDRRLKFTTGINTECRKPSCTDV